MLINSLHLLLIVPLFLNLKLSFGRFLVDHMLFVLSLFVILIKEPSQISIVLKLSLVLKSIPILTILIQSYLRLIL